MGRGKKIRDLKSGKKSQVEKKKDDGGKRRKKGEKEGRMWKVR